VHSDELLEQRTACVAVDSLEVAHDHTTTLVSPRGERWSVRLARCLVGRGSHRPPPDFDGDLDYAPLWAGESCSVVNDIKPAAEIVLELVRDAEAALAEAEQPAQALPRPTA
jgi:hypothetical protein